MRVVPQSDEGGLGRPQESISRVRQQEDGYRPLAAKAARLLERYQMIAKRVETSHPAVVSDEHQDSSGDQQVAARLSPGSRRTVAGG